MSNDNNNAWQQLGMESLPADLPNELTGDLLESIHNAIMQIRVKEGKMICNGCSHVYPIKDGIPNMLLSEREV